MYIEGGVIMKGQFYECSMQIGSLTQAMKTQSTLSAAAIPSEIIKTESSSRHGCVYGVSYSCSQENNVRAVLENAKLSARRRTHR